MPSDLREIKERWEPHAHGFRMVKSEVAYADIAALFARIEELTATFTENQRERYAEEHAKVLGLEAERDALRVRLSEAEGVLGGIVRAWDGLPESEVPFSSVLDARAFLAPGTKP